MTLIPGLLPGIRVGHFTDTRRPTGCTVLLCPQGAVAGVDVRGAAPGTRETDLLAPENTVKEVHAILLAGGSAFGLDAAAGVMRWLRERGHGLPAGSSGLRVPIVPAAVLFDLHQGADPSIHPDEAAGYAACEAALAEPPAQGRVGAGTGATVSKLLGPGRALPGGIGWASLSVGTVTVNALVAVNAVGDVIDPVTGRFRGAADALLRGEAPFHPSTGTATTLGIVATNARLDKAQAKKLAQMSHDGLARTIKPVHTPFDGDVIFSLSTSAIAEADLTVLGVMAAEAVAQAVLNAVQHARKP